MYRWQGVWFTQRGLIMGRFGFLGIMARTGIGSAGIIADVRGLAIASGVKTQHLWGNRTVLVRIWPGRNCDVY